MEFLTYIQKFPHLQFNEEMEGEDIELLKERLRKISKARLELEKFKEITELELVQLYNLCPVISAERRPRSKKRCPGSLRWSGSRKPAKRCT